MKERREVGPGVAEYALILGLIAVVALGSLMFLGGTVTELLRFVADSL